MAMTDEHKQVLLRLRKTFVDNLDLKPVVDSLVSSGILTAEDEDRIGDRESTHDSIRFLMKLLPRKGDIAFYALYDALENTPWLQDAMQDKAGEGAAGESECYSGMQMDTQKAADLSIEDEEHRCVVPDTDGRYQHWSVLCASPNTSTGSDDKFDHTYDMKCQLKGRAYILNNFCNNYGLHYSERQFASIDTHNLAHLVRELGYDAEVHVNLSSEDIKSTICSFATTCLQEDTHASAIIAIISSGGLDNGFQYILGTDNRPVYLREDIYNPICECSTMTQKPKLFFVQINNPEVKKCPIMHPDPPHVKPHLDPGKHQDCFVASTFTTGHYSHRTNIPGSWFVQLLCEVMLEEAHSTHFDDMMQMVADSVGRCNRFFDFETNEIVENNEYVIRDTTLDKQMYFLPHYEPLQTLAHPSSNVSLPSWFFQEKKDTDEITDE